LPVTTTKRGAPRSRTVSAQTMDRIGAAIVAGLQPQGTALPPEPQLGAAFGVSRTVVREAVKALIAKGLLVSGPKLGTRVLPREHWNWFDADVVAWSTRAGLSRELLRDLHELRRVVEPAAVRLAAQRATPADMVALQEALAAMDTAAHQKQGGKAYVEHDLRFHQAILRASHNHMFVQVGKALAPLLSISFDISSDHGRGAAASMAQHRKVLHAIAKHQPDAAERHCRVLIDAAGADIERVFLGS
jgi:DNA-binding FadR family transcriptional regulator